MLVPKTQYTIYSTQPSMHVSTDHRAPEARLYNSFSHWDRTILPGFSDYSSLSSYCVTGQGPWGSHSQSGRRTRALITLEQEAVSLTWLYIVYWMYPTPRATHCTLPFPRGCQYSSTFWNCSRSSRIDITTTSTNFNFDTEWTLWRNEEGEPKINLHEQHRFIKFGKYPYYESSLSLSNQSNQIYLRQSRWTI